MNSFMVVPVEDAAAVTRPWSSVPCNLNITKIFYLNIIKVIFKYLVHLQKINLIKKYYEPII